MTKLDQIKILLVADQAIIREGCRSLIHRQSDMKIIAEGCNGEEAYNFYKQYKPNLVIIELSLPGQGGIATIEQIKKYDAVAKILVFTRYQDPIFVIKATQAGALGYITKNNTPDVLLRAIYDVYDGKITLSKDISQALALEQLGGINSILAELTVREFEIFRMLAEGSSTKNIAEILKVSPKTVSNYHYLIKRKLGVDNDIELTHFAIKSKVINLK